MRVNGKLVLLIVVGLAVYAMQKYFKDKRAAEAPTGPTAAATPAAGTSAAPTSRVNVRDRAGTPVPLDLPDGSATLVIGTWDNRSRNLINALNDPAFQQYLHGTRITYLIERDEWRNVKQRMRDSYRGTMSEEEMDARIAARRAAGGNSTLYDESVVDAILGTGSVVYFFHPEDGINARNLPAFHTRGSTFTTTREEFLRRQGVPDEVARTTLAKYDKAS